MWRARCATRRRSRAISLFGLFLPLIGFHTHTDIRNELILSTRWPLLFSIGRRRLRRALLYSLVIAPWLARRAMRPARGAAGLARLLSASGSFPSPSALSIVYPVIVHRRGRLRRRAEMDRQFRHPDSDLRDARLGAQHRRRPRRPARPRLRRLLRGRRLFLRAACQELRLLVLDVAAARRHPVVVLGHPARLSGAAAARRLPRHRHAGLRRNHPPHPDQFRRPDQRLCRHQRHSAAELFRHSVQRRR